MDEGVQKQLRTVKTTAEYKNQVRDCKSDSYIS